uniref:Formin-like protein 13 n=1 Tax=Tanacetum cinerariifolium TaxID=118510 RepID=A0A699H1A3_TANCI|nr:formin-like protein 13 [Tanacetum cinerariifolium]
MVHKHAPVDLLPKMLPVNPVPSHLRYLYYVSRRKGDREWPPAETSLALDCVIMRMIPDFDGKGGSCAALRIYGCNPLLHLAKSLTLFFSTPRKRKNIRYFYQVEVRVLNTELVFGGHVEMQISFNGYMFKFALGMEEISSICVVGVCSLLRAKKTCLISGKTQAPIV